MYRARMQALSALDRERKEKANKFAINKDTRLSL